MSEVPTRQQQSDLNAIIPNDKHFQMKRIMQFFLFLIMPALTAVGQERKEILTEKVKVQGVCGQCKKRIENAAYIPGVKRAEWDKSSKDLTVTFRADKTSLDAIEKEIAGTGHATENIQAADSAYNALPECCAYKDGHDH